MVAHAYEVPVLPVGPPEIGVSHPMLPPRMECPPQWRSPRIHPNPGEPSESHGYAELTKYEPTMRIAIQPAKPPRQHDQNRGKCVASPRARPASDHPRGSGSTPRREERHREPGEGDGEVKGKRMRSPSSLSWRNHPKGSKGCASFMGSSKGIEKQTMWAAYSPGCTESCKLLGIDE